MITIQLNKDEFQINTIVTAGTYAEAQFYKLVADLVAKEVPITVMTYGTTDADVFSVGLLTAMHSGKTVFEKVTCMDVGNVQDKVIYELYEHLDEDAVCIITKAVLDENPALLHVNYNDRPCIMNAGACIPTNFIRPSVLPCVRKDNLFSIN